MSWRNETSKQTLKQKGKEKKEKKKQFFESVSKARNQKFYQAIKFRPLQNPWDSEVEGC